jgi:hypothetical protein
VVEAEWRGRSGTAGWPAAGGGRRRGRPEVEGAPDMCVPHVTERKRGVVGGGRAGGPYGPESVMGRGGKGRGVGRG